MRRLLLALLFLVAATLLLTAVAVRLRYGGGSAYPDLTATPLLDESALEAVASFPEPIGNVAVSDGGRLFFTVHPESRPAEHRLMEWTGDGARPFPSADAQRELFDTVLGVVIDREDRLWTIDHGNHGLRQPRLLALDLATGRVVHDHPFDRAIAPRGSFLQDLRVDPAGDRVYIADLSFWRGSPALIVYDVSSQRARRVLERHPSVVPQDWVITTSAKRMVFLGGLAALKPGVDGIALDPEGQWLYFGAMAHDGLFRIPARDLRESTLGPRVLAQRVERVRDKPLSDGLAIDAEGRVYITDVEHGAALRVGADGALQTVIRSSRIRWADSLCFGPDGWLYLADSALPEVMLRSKQHILAAGPYHVFRFRPPAWEPEGHQPLGVRGS
jgi:sugar lactone lactonase YvrE